METELRKVYSRFATFGNRTGGGPVLMDSRSCQKLAKDCGLVGRVLTTTDIDLIFAQCKTKGKQRIDFNQFVDCTRHWASKLRQSHAEIVLKIIQSSGPKINSLVPQESARSHSSSGSEANTPEQDVSPTPSKQPRAMARLHPDYYEVENPNYTGEHDRFYYVNRITKETTWVVPYLVPTKDLSVPPPPSSPPSGGSFRSRQKNREPISPAFPSSHYEREINSESKQQDMETPPRRNNSKRDIFDKLTDPRLYTGAHRHRFDTSTGKGRGLAGRDNAFKGNGSGAKINNFHGHTNTGTDTKVHSIAQVLRPGF
mmetsp:Transcript_13817/g.23764  ORF Transcript_13817/g.23764 Transcript_13817/m.23764 type:complete len:313 (-) Transcript_13817:233-1171(-)|eukprot:CAMPEP_0171486516 /NCGR_PEP_ID=MMETSP0958-20121227/1134_1 /TAXON_ID=87120 /ORGANISM="Aurantiochytrium limacinum, Strain ATCCMYA-1381" /LENGTH=312 /DNA_ID=CAMNT_0012019405 /DNA_START=186 /DNA_END=1124 /DNA_ORIENTATION=-